MLHMHMQHMPLQGELSYRFKTQQRRATCDDDGEDAISWNLPKACLLKMRVW